MWNKNAQVLCKAFTIKVERLIVIIFLLNLTRSVDKIDAKFEEEIRMLVGINKDI